MITEGMLYWATRLDHFHAFLLGLNGITIVGTIILIIGSVIGHNNEEAPPIFRTYTAAIVISIVSLIVCMLLVLTPTFKEFAVIKVLPVIAQHETTQSLGEVGKTLVEVAQEWAQELRSEVADK